jgi:hypothetical protein
MEGGANGEGGLATRLSRCPRPWSLYKLGYYCLCISSTPPASTNRSHQYHTFGSSATSSQQLSTKAMAAAREKATRRVSRTNSRVWGRGSVSSGVQVISKSTAASGEHGRSTEVRDIPCVERENAGSLHFLRHRCAYETTHRRLSWCGRVPLRERLSRHRHDQHGREAGRSAMKG